MAFIPKAFDRTLVPWFSMCEWEDVYQQVYSGDPLYVNKAYERMLVWKTRCPALPTGVNSTMNLIQVWLQDREVVSQIARGLLPPHREQDVRVMFSTAIMRFLNQIAEVAQDGTETMYTMAKKLHIPDWVVNIRHDAAHGLSLPPITVLREAMQFCLTWIHEHYWQGETEKTKNCVVNQIPQDQANEYVTNELQEYIELWQALKLYEQTNYSDVDSIPDYELKLRLKNIIQSNLEKGFQISKIPSKSKGGNKSHAKVVMNNWTTIELLEQIINHMEKFLTRNKNIIDKEEIVDLILEGETFIPDKNVLLSLYINDEKRNNSHPIQLLQLWEGVLIALQPTNILPILLQKLIDITARNEENEYRQSMAAIWIKELSRGIAKARTIHQFKQEYEQMYTDQKSDKEIMGDFARVNPESRNIMSLELTCLPVITKDFVESTMLMPNKWMCIFLSSLLELIEPALADSTKKHLCKLLKTYTSEERQPGDFDRQNQVYTVDMLREECDMKDSFAPENTVAIESTENYQRVQDACASEENPSGWAVCKDVVEWENCPLGVLPWHWNMVSLDFALPSDLVWAPSKPVPASETFSHELRLPSNKKINWKAIKQSQKQKKQKRSISNLVKKALKTVGYFDVKM